MSQELEESIPDYEFKCRDSDYRMVLSDPDFDVVDIKSDVSTNGNLMLTAVTAVHKSGLYQVTYIALLMGGECYVRDDI